MYQMVYTNYPLSEVEEVGSTRLLFYYQHHRTDVSTIDALTMLSQQARKTPCYKQEYIDSNGTYNSMVRLSGKRRHVIVHAISARHMIEYVPFTSGIARTRINTSSPDSHHAGHIKINPP